MHYKLPSEENGLIEEPLRKNHRIETEITGMTLQGDGIARCGGVPVFIPAACTGDRLRVRMIKTKRNCAFGRMEELITASPDRVDPGCGVFPRCGGCAFRHISYEAELALKQRELAETLRRIGKVNPPMRPIIAAPSTERCRNKAVFSLRREGDRVVWGHYARQSHQVIPCGDCLLMPEAFHLLAQILCAWAEEAKCSVYNEATGKGLLRQIYLRQNRDGEILLTLVINGGGIPHADELLHTLRQNHAVKGILLGHAAPGTAILERCTPLWGAALLTEYLCGLRFALSPLSFFQVNTAQAERLYAICGAFAGADHKAPKLLDLYCGTGTIGLCVLQALGRQGELIGVESVPQAVEDARCNAAANGFGNARFLCMDAVQAVAQLANEGWQPNVILIDPPRKGCEAALLHMMTQMRPDRILYISCDPATLARDLALLAERGYEALEAVPVDMFPRTGHVETIVRLERVPAP